MSAQPTSAQVAPSKSREATIVQWAARLMITKGYGWSKAMDTARSLYGERK